MDKKYLVILGGISFKYNTLKQLQKEAVKYGIKIGNSAKIGYSAEIGNSAKIGYSAEIGNSAKIGNYAEIGDSAKIGNSAKIGYSAKIGNYAEIGDSAKIGYYAKIGDSVIILIRAIVGVKWVISKITHLMNEYKYHVSGFVIEGEIIIQMGCFTRSLKEWEEDFWNNPGEFTKDSKEGKARLKAFKKMKKIMLMK